MKRMLVLIVAALGLSAVVLLVGGRTRADESRVMGFLDVEAPSLRRAPKVEREPGVGPALLPSPGPGTPALKLVRTGSAEVEVRDLDAALGALRRLVEGQGGYLGALQVEHGPGPRQAEVTVRVPTARFGTAQEGLRSLGTLRRERMEVQDVTRAYTDLEARLRVKRAAEARIRELMTGRAAKLSEVLEAEKELARLVEEIEGLEGERRVYDQDLALSTLTVTLAEPGAVSGARVWGPLRRALGASGRTLAESAGLLVSVLMAVLPWGLLAGLSLLAARRIRRNRTS